MDTTSIKTEAEYRSALKKIEGLMGASRDSSEGERLGVLVTLVEAYERMHYPLGARVPYRKPAAKG